MVSSLFKIFSLVVLSLKFSQLLNERGFMTFIFLYMVLDFCFIVCSHILFFILKRDEEETKLLFLKLYQIWEKLPYSEKAVSGYFLICFGVPNKILINNEVPGWVTIVVVFYMKISAQTYPFLDFVLFFYLLFIISSSIFGRLYEGGGRFKAYFDSWVFSGTENSDLRQKILVYLFGNMFSQADKKFVKGLLGGGGAVLVLERLDAERQRAGKYGEDSLKILEANCSNQYPHGPQGRIDLLHALQLRHLENEPGHKALMAFEETRGAALDIIIPRKIILKPTIKELAELNLPKDVPVKKYHTELNSKELQTLIKKIKSTSPADCENSWWVSF